MRDYQDRLLRALVNHLKAISQKVEAIAADQARANQSAEPVPPREHERVSAEVDFPEKVVNRYYAEQGKTYPFQKWGFWVSVGTLIIIIIYTVASLGQWDAVTEQLEQTQASLAETRRALLLTDRQTKASEEASRSAGGSLAIAEKALKASERTTRLEQRPYVVQSGTIATTNLPPTKGNKITVVATLKNVGKSIAKDAIVFYKLTKIYGRPTQEEQRVQVDTAFNDARKDAKNFGDKREDIAPDGITATLAGRATIDVFSDPEIAAFKLGSVGVLFIGGVTYRDIFGETHTTEFCFAWFGEDVTVGSHCDTHNVIR